MVMQCVLFKEKFVLLCQRSWQKLGYCLAKIPRGSRAYARVFFGVNHPLELDILQKLYYLRKEIKCIRILFAC